MGDRSSPLWAIIADDLTGACDTAAQFANVGYTAIVALDWSVIPACSSDVVAASTDSRADTPADAAGKVARLASVFRCGKNRLVYKKIDSALRGNLAAEIEACLESFDGTAAVIAPSFPSLGRSIAGGRLNAAAGMAAVHLPTLLAEQGMAALTHVDRARLAGWLGNCAARPENEKAAGRRRFVFDAVTDSDLAAVIDAAEALGERNLWVGSGGLARQLAKRCAEEDRKGMPPREPFVQSAMGTDKILLAIGSDHPVTAGQMKMLAAGRVVESVRPDPVELNRAIAALRAGRALVLQIEPGRTSPALLRGFLQAVQLESIQGLVLSGGDTASLVCSALGAATIRLEGEIAAGIPWGRIGGGLADGLRVATKSGGFGAPDALVVTVDFFSRRPIEAKG